MSKSFQEAAREFAERLNKVSTPISAAEHNRRAHALKAQEEMNRRAKEIPLERLQAILDQGQEAYLDRLRELEAEPDPIEEISRNNWGR
jgi:hypothetical protein